MGGWAWLAARPHRSLSVALLLACCLRLPFLGVPLGADEAGYLYVARQWPGSGHWLYGEQWVDRPPVLLLVFKVAALLGGSPIALRLLAMLVACALVAAAWWVGRTLAGADGALAAGLIAAAVSSSPVINGYQLVGDAIAAMFGTLSCACLLSAIQLQARSSGRGTHAAALTVAAGAGLTASLALLTKQNAVVAGVVAALLLLHRPRRRWPLALAYAVGALLPLGATALWAATGPGLGPFLNAVWTFRVQAVHVVEARPSGPDHRLVLFLAAPVAAGLAVPLLHTAYDVATRRGAWAIRATVVVAAACLAASLALSLNWFDYYWLAVVPFAALGVAVAFVPGPRHGRAPVFPRAVALLTVAVAVTSVVTWTPVPSTIPAEARFLAAAARPGDSMVVVWGQPEYLVDAGLRTPYPYSWSLEVRVEDPHLRLFAATVAGPQAPTWLLEIGHLDDWRMETRRVARLVADDYHLVARVCGHRILLRDGDLRPVRAAVGVARAVPCPVRDQLRRAEGPLTSRPPTR